MVRKNNRAVEAARRRRSVNAAGQLAKNGILMIAAPIIEAGGFDHVFEIALLDASDDIRESLRRVVPEDRGGSATGEANRAAWEAIVAEALAMKGRTIEFYREQVATAERFTAPPNTR